MSKSRTQLKTQSISSLPLFRAPPVPWKPHRGQKLGMKWLLEHQNAGLFADPGVGKTSITYGAFKILRQKGQARRMLVVAPLKPAWLVWPAEAEKWTDFYDLKVVVLHGPDKEEKLQEDADVYVVNFDGLLWLTGAETSKTPTGKTRVKVNLKRIMDKGFDILVIDELSKTKHPSSARHKALKQIIHLFSRRWGLTGSPASNGLMDLFGQIYMLDMGKALGQFITHYRHRYFVPDFQDPRIWRLQHGAEDLIYKQLEPLVLRLDADDYVDMPSVKDVMIKLELPPEARRVYDQLEEDLIAQLGESTITAVSAGVASMKCRQIAAGGIYLNDDLLKLFKKSELQRRKRDWLPIHDEKTEALVDLVDELQGRPLLVAYDFNHDLDRIRAKLGDVPHLGAGVAGRRAQEIEAAWNRGELPVLLGHPQSMGHGLNLQGSGCCHVCWYSLTWDYELYDQFIRRVRRQGATVDRVFVHHLVMRDTVDENIVWALRRKERTQRALLDALKQLRTKGRGRD